jgi:catechol 2,3-dioxygenase-like lactoylglutathione lyase family enzyme
MIVGLGHVDLVCRRLERSLAFYAAVFGPLGLQPPFIVEGERGEQIHYLRFPQPGSGSLGLRQAQDDTPFELYAPGLHHLALAVESRADVVAAHAAAIAAGARELHPPQLWPVYHPEYYAAFFCDPDGFRLEVAASRDARLQEPDRERARHSASSTAPSVERAAPSLHAVSSSTAGNASRSCSSARSR